MALPLNERLQALFLDTVKKPQLILEVDGWPTLSSIPTQKYPKYGDPELYYGMPGLFYGTPINDPSVLPYIDLSRSTNQISQQLLTDKGGFTSSTNFEIAIVDKDQLISQYVSPDFIVDDALSKKAKIYLCLEGAAHPQESILFFSGIITDITTNAGLVKLNVASGEKLKSQEIFTKISTDTTALIGPSDTTINVLTTSGLLLPADGSTFMTYVRIDDEIIGYTGYTTNQLTGCTRGQLGTVADSHQSGTNVESFYRLQGNVRDLALKLMLGGYDGAYASDIPIVAFNSYAGDNASNSIFISNFNIDQTLGVSAQDTLTIAGSTTNDGSYPVLGFTSTDTGSYITVDGVINSEAAAGTISLTSKYNVLPAGASLGMTPDQVDVAQFERIYNQFSSQFFSYDFYIKDGVNGTDFINQQILYPSGGYAIPRKAKTSMGLTIPPLAQSGTVVLDEQHIVGASKIAVRRSVSKNFYNAVIYKYDPLAIEDRYTRGKIRQSADSTNRIKIANKPLMIEADGVRTSGNFDFIFNTQARRFLDRYQYAAESFDTEVLFGIGFGIEIGDSVVLDGSSLNITDSTNGTRIFEPRLFEVQNKSYSLTGKTVKLTLVDTVYSLSVRYGVIAPSSKIGSGSTIISVVLKESFSDSLFNNSPNKKWQNYIGERVLVHDKEWTYQEETRIVGFDATNNSLVLIDPPLSAAPTEDMIFEVGKYGITNTNPSENSLTKVQHCFTTKQVIISSGINDLSFIVSSGDEIYFRIGESLQVHNEDYSQQSNIVKISTVVGTTITLNTSLGISPIAGNFVEFLGFADGGSSYSFI